MLFANGLSLINHQFVPRSEFGQSLTSRSSPLVWPWWKMVVSAHGNTHRSDRIIPSVYLSLYTQICVILLL